MAKPKKKQEQHVVRQWASSPVIYGPLRSKSNEDIHDNPDHHPTIGLTSRGEFVDLAGRKLDPKSVPDYIKADAKRSNLDIEYHPPKRHEVGLDDAMLGAGVPDTEPDPRVRASRRRAA